jgi:light-regulated signal transduction histidine kinase (bacteriophytochrome)
VNLLKKRYNNKLDKNADEFIEIIVDSTKRMEQLIDNLLGYARVSMSTKKFNHTDYNKILERSISNLTVAIEDSRAKINIDPLPALMANDLQIECLFQNLISNAIKFHGKEPPIIHVSAEKKEHDWMFSVRDNGIGIEPKDKDRIFNMFQRLHSKSKYAGTGIGLSVCKNIVDNHGGRIWVESDSGKGSNFFFSIPDNQ